MYPGVPLVPNMDTILIFLWHSLASPKSDIFGQNPSSRRMFSGFMSKCTILVLHPRCRYSRPRAVPTAIRYKVSQSKEDDPLLPMNLSNDLLGMNS
ncbi:hypothetical protein LguiB_033203 [Lonicera macranthoides]